MVGRDTLALLASAVIAIASSACAEGHAERAELEGSARPSVAAQTSPSFTNDMRLAPTKANRRIGADRFAKSRSAALGDLRAPVSRAIGSRGPIGLDPLTWTRTPSAPLGMNFAPALASPSARVAASRHRPPPERGPWNPPPPQVTTLGGAVLAAPRIVPIFYSGDPMIEPIDAFAQRFATSAFWGFASEYGVGPATKLPRTVVSLPPPARLTSGQVSAFVQIELRRGVFPAYDPNNIYVIYFAPETTITIPGFGDSCKEFGAYHAATQDSAGRLVPYAVIPRCNGYLNHFGIDAVTSATSHEVLEAATDPFGDAFVDANWQATGMAFAFEGGAGGELSDFCEFMPGVDVVDPEVGNLVERFWSNQRAAAGHDPCVPAPDRPYFNALPILGGASAGLFEWFKGVSVPPGGQATIPVKLFSDAPAGEWDLSAAEGVNPHLPPDTFNQLSFEFDVPRGRAGDVRYLTIKRTPLPPGQRSGFLPFAIVSKQGAVENFWWVVVGQ